VKNHAFPRRRNGGTLHCLQHDNPSSGRTPTKAGHTRRREGVRVLGRVSAVPAGSGGRLRQAPLPRPPAETGSAEWCRRACSLASASPGSCPRGRWRFPRCCWGEGGGKCVFACAIAWAPRAGTLSSAPGSEMGRASWGMAATAGENRLQHPLAASFAPPLKSPPAWC